MLQTMVIAGLFVVAGISGCTRGSDQRILAEIRSESGGEVVTVGDLKKALAEQADNYGPEILHDPEGSLVIKKKILNALIEEIVLVNAAREKKILISDEESQTLRDRLRSGYAAGEFERILRKQNLSYEDWFERQKRKRLIEKLIQQEVHGQVVVTDEEIDQYYQRYKTLFRVPDRVHCRHIVTSKRDKAETIRHLLDKGENFANVAKKFSESPDRENGGDLGWIAHGEYPAIFEQACFTLITGQTSDVIPSEYGYHLFRVVEKKPGRQKSLAEVKGEIERRLREEKALPLLRTWIDALYRNQKIAIDEKALKEVSVPRSPETQQAPETQPGEE